MFENQQRSTGVREEEEEEGANTGTTRSKRMNAGEQRAQKTKREAQQSRQRDKRQSLSLRYILRSTQSLGYVCAYALQNTEQVT